MNEELDGLSQFFSFIMVEILESEKRSEDAFKNCESFFINGNTDLHLPQDLGVLDIKGKETLSTKLLVFAGS